MENYHYKYGRYYNKGEIRDFENNECEWPIFYTYMIIDGVFKNNTEQIEEYQAELRKCMYSDECGGKPALALSVLQTRYTDLIAPPTQIR